jgi:hypothetical protein
MKGNADLLVWAKPIHARQGHPKRAGAGPVHGLQRKVPIVIPNPFTLSTVFGRRILLSST